LPGTNSGASKPVEYAAKDGAESARRRTPTRVRMDAARIIEPTEFGIRMGGNKAMQRESRASRERAPLIRLRHLLPTAMDLRWGEGYLLMILARVVVK
jgi:hypothetical protein